MSPATSAHTALAPAPLQIPAKRTGRHLLEWLLVAALSGMFLLHGIVPGWRTLDSDFPDYYMVARLYRSGYRLDRIYEWEWLQRQKDRLELSKPLVGYAPNPPLCFTLVLPLASLPPLAAKRCWLLVNLVLLAAVVALLRRMTQLPWRRLSILVLIAVVPLSNNFALGQIYVVLLLLMTLALYAWLNRRNTVCGLLLAAGAVVKLYPAVFVLYFVRKKQWRTAATLLAGIVASVAAAVWLVGLETVRAFATEVLPRAMRGELMDPYNLRLNSIVVLLHHLFVAEPDLNPSPLAHLPRMYAIMQPVCMALLIATVLVLLSACRRDPQREKINWALFTGLMLLISPQPATYHYVLLITPAIIVIDHALQVHRRLATALIAAYAIVCLPIPPSLGTRVWLAVLNMPRLWGMLLFLALVSLLLESRTNILNKRDAAAFATVVIVFALPGIWINWQNLTARSQPGERIPTASAWMAADAVLTENRILFTAMAPEGYVVEALAAGQAVRLPLPPDAYHPTTASGNAWAELSARSSRIVRFGATGKIQNTEVADGEQPVVSPEGRWLAFMRETAGRSALWITRLPASPGAELRVTPPFYDVSEAAFMPDSTLVFSAHTPDGSGLFRVSNLPVGPPRLWIAGALRYPAVSPDGRWAAFSRRERGSWHLWTHNLATGEEILLTSGGCNSIMPAWSSDSKQLIYATDCGRGLGLTALRRLRGNW